MTWSVMADVPNPIIVDAAGTAGSGYVLKAYLPGTTTATSIVIDSDGSSPQASLTANSEGKWEVSGNEVLPYIDRDHKWGIFVNQTDADANTPFYMGPFDNVALVGDSSSVTYNQGGTGALTRTVQDRLRDIVTVSDFGSDHAAFTAALATGESIYVPDGNYSIDDEIIIPGSNVAIILSAGVKITQTTADKAVFKATSLDNVWIIANGAILFGEGSWSSGWTGNSGHDDRVVNFRGCTNSGITDAVIKNGANAGLSIEGCKNFKGTNLTIEGTHTHSTPLSSLDNFQNGIFVKHSSTYGDCEDILITFDISGTAQGILVEARSGYTGDSGVQAYGLIHDIPGQHGMYVQAGNCTIDVVVRDVELDGVKVQINQAGQALDNVSVNVNCQNAGSHALEIQDANMTGSMTNITGNVIAENCQRGLGLNDNIKQSNFTVLATDSTQYGAIVQGDGLDDVEIDLRSTGSGRHGLYVLAPDCTNVRIKPTIRQANTTVGSYDGINIEEAGDLVLIDPVATDADSNQRYGFFAGSSAGLVKVRGSAEFTGATAQSARANVEIEEWPEEVTLDGRTADQLLNFSNFTKSTRRITTTAQTTSASNVTLWQKTIPEDTALGINVEITANLNATLNTSGTHSSGDNEAVLTDSTQAWTVNEFVGETLRNITDGSTTTVTSNTATTITGVLSGGTDNDWDTNDKYSINKERAAYTNKLLAYRNGDGDVVKEGSTTISSLSSDGWSGGWVWEASGSTIRIRANSGATEDVEWKARVIYTEIT